MKTIEALAPGLYEMTIDEQIGEGVERAFPRVSFTRTQDERTRRRSTIRATTRTQFATVSRLSELGLRILRHAACGPFVQASVTRQAAEAMRKTHPARAPAGACSSDENPLMKRSRRRRHESREGAPPAERGQSLPRAWRRSGPTASSRRFDFWRDMRDAAYEMTFFGIYGSPGACMRLGASQRLDAQDGSTGRTGASARGRGNPARRSIAAASRSR